MTSLGERNKDGLSASPKISGRWLSSWRFFSNGLDQPPTRLVISHILLTWVCFWMPPGHPKARLVMMKFTEKTGLKYLKLLFTNRYPKWNLILEATEASSKKPSIILLVSVGSIWSRGREFFKKKIKPTGLEATVQRSSWRDQLYLKWKLIFHPPSLLALQHVHFPGCPCVCLLDDVLRIRSWD